MVDSDERQKDRERTRELFARLPDDEAARDELVNLHMPLVEYLARRFRGRGEPLDDLVQVASMGLLKAIARFDPERGVEFSTYATPTIIGELKRYFRDKGWAIRIPRRLQEIGLQLSKIVPTMSQELGRSPSIPEIAKRTQFSEEEVLEAMNASQAYSLVSLDAPTSEGGADAFARLGAEDESLELFERWSSVAHLLERLPSRERKILYLRFVTGETQSQIADQLGISQMHVSRLLTRTLTYLREAATADDRAGD